MWDNRKTEAYLLLILFNTQRLKKLRHLSNTFIKNNIKINGIYLKKKKNHTHFWSKTKKWSFILNDKTSLKLDSHEKHAWETISCGHDILLHSHELICQN